MTKLKPIKVFLWRCKRCATAYGQPEEDKGCGHEDDDDTEATLCPDGCLMPGDEQKE